MRTVARYLEIIWHAGCIMPLQGRHGHSGVLWHGRMGRVVGPRCALAAKLTFAHRNENAEEVIFSGEAQEGCQEGHEEEGCEEEEVTFLDLARPEGDWSTPCRPIPD